MNKEYNVIVSKKLREGFSKVAANAGVFGIPLDGTAGKSPVRLRRRLQRLKDMRQRDADYAYMHTFLKSLFGFGK